MCRSYFISDDVTMAWEQHAQTAKFQSIIFCNYIFVCNVAMLLDVMSPVSMVANCFRL